MANIIILALLAAALIFGVKSYAGKLAHGCCGAGGDGAVKKVRVADRDASHYPYAVKIGVTGMTCSNCKRRVENALNGIDGVFAEADLAKACAVVRMKAPVPEDLLRRVVAQAGYGVSTYDTILDLIDKSKGMWYNRVEVMKDEADNNHARRIRGSQSACKAE